MMTLAFRKFIATIGATVLAASTLPATTFVVNNTADSGAGSLRQAILNANTAGGGFIVFSNVSGTITVSSALPAITAGVNITGPGANTMIISGGGSFSVFAMNAGTTNFLANLTIANTYAQYQSTNGSETTGPASTFTSGSGVANSGSLIISNCVFSNCLAEASYGGAIYNGGTLAVQNCLITSSGSKGENAEVYGGAVYNGGALTMNGCTVTNCVATRGGGIYNDGGNASLTNCVIEMCQNDDSEGDGAAIYNLSGNLSIVAGVIANNYAGWWGGGIASWTNLTMINTTVADNDGEEGGGLYLAGGTNYFQNCTVSGNTADQYGGGGLENSAQLTMVNCTISENLSFFAAGGGILNAGQLVLTDCTVVSNNTVNAVGGSGVQNDGSGKVYAADTILADNNTNDFTGALISQGNNLIKTTNGCALSGNVAGNIYGVDPLLGPLQNNGGLTMTHALLPGSPAIDAGPANAAPDFDQRGLHRPSGAADDIGAFEYGAVPSPALLALTPTSGGGFHIGLTGTPGFAYTVMRAPSPAGPWTSLTSAMAGYDGCGACLDTNTPASRAFYRVAYQSH